MCSSWFMQLSRHLLQAERIIGGRAEAGEGEGESRTARRKGRKMAARVEW